MSQERLTLGTNIKQLCNERGKSVRQIEREAGVAERTINRWDENFPSIDKVVLVANALEVPLEEVVFGKKITATKSDGDSSAKLADFISAISNLSEEQLSALLLIAKTLAAGQ